MKKYSLGLFLVFVLCMAPFATSALSAYDVQTQIAQLLAKVAELTAQIDILKRGGESTAVSPLFPPGMPHKICAIVRNLSTGAQGDDVQSLQEFLRTEGYLNAEASGYFGALTRDALARWQAANGVESAGSLGPKTRDRMRAWCGGGVSNERFSASPNRGNAPLTVVFSTWISGFRVPTVSYVIDYGDGSSERAADCPAPADACIGPGQNTHTYTANGSYTATLTKITDPCPDDGDPTTPRCLAAIQSEIIGKQHITVGAVACTKEYKPVCGLKQVVCIMAPCNPVPTTYSNKCMMQADGATFSYEGKCRAATIDPSADPQCKIWSDGKWCGQTCSRTTPGGVVGCAIPSCVKPDGPIPPDQGPYCKDYFGNSSDPSTNPQCKSWYDGCNTCSRSEIGGPAMCTLKACIMGVQTKPYCTSYFGDSGNKAPTISGFSGPTTLKVDEMGTWTVKASDPEGQDLSYSISWGDERHYGSALSMASTVFSQTTTFTHSYSVAGTYTVAVVVRDASGKEARASLSVHVTQNTGEPVACTMEYAPVCGTKYEMGFEYCSGMQTHTGPCRKDYTYGNRCALNAAGATYLYAGSCLGY